MALKTFGHKVIEFNKKLQYKGVLPQGFKVLNPYMDNPETLRVIRAFYEKYYSDTKPRKFVIGINPSRHGAGVTGIPFTDTKRLDAFCGIKMQSAYTHEVSSVFMYDMISAMGGAKFFYDRFYINSPFPLAIVRRNHKGDWLNANYYDDPSLFNAVSNFMIQSMRNHIALGLETDKVFILGKRNAAFINTLNAKSKLFNQAIVLEHPRYIQQYKSRDKQLYIDKYIKVFTEFD